MALSLSGMSRSIRELALLTSTTTAIILHRLFLAVKTFEIPFVGIINQHSWNQRNDKARETNTTLDTTHIARGSTFTQNFARPSPPPRKTCPPLPNGKYPCQSRLERCLYRTTTHRGDKRLVSRALPPLRLLSICLARPRVGLRRREM